MNKLTIEISKRNNMTTLKEEINNIQNGKIYCLYFTKYFNVSKDKDYFLHELILRNNKYYFSDHKDFYTFSPPLTNNFTQLSNINNDKNLALLNLNNKHHPFIRLCCEQILQGNEVHIEKVK
jgi:hypothetical protein